MMRHACPGERRGWDINISALAGKINCNLGKTAVVFDGSAHGFSTLFLRCIRRAKQLHKLVATKKRGEKQGV